MRSSLATAATLAVFLAAPLALGQEAPPGAPLAAPPAAPPAAPAASRLIQGWAPDQPVPRGYRRVTTLNGAMLAAGISLFSVSYSLTTVTAAIAGAVDEEDFDGTSGEDWAALYIPLAGPFIAIHSLDPNPQGAGLLVADGILQVAGMALLLGGALDTDTHLLRVATPFVAPLPGGGVAGVAAHF
jgi:hypothetical protein